jgi:acetyl-CoA acetyltransferase
VSTAYILDAVRSPFGRYGGGLASVRPDDLAAHVVRALLDRTPELDPGQVDDVLFGDANQAGEDNRNVARMAWLLNGLPTSVPGATINRLCGSSLDAAMQASRAIESDDASIVVVGGVESMSRAPWIMLKPDRPFPRDHAQLYSSTLGWRMVNPKMPEQWAISLGQSAEKLAEMYGISREAQDQFALRSHRRALAGWESGYYGNWVVPVPETDLERDETIRPDTSLERLAKLKPAFAEDVARGAAGVDPDVFGIAPVQAAENALWRAGIAWEDVAVVELNEAFASQCLADIGQWRGLDPEKVNPNGGAIALGHPLGASGVRVLGGLAHELARRGGGFGVAALCIGVGQGLAVVLEA